MHPVLILNYLAFQLIKNILYTEKLIKYLRKRTDNKSSRPELMFVVIARWIKVFRY